MSVVSALPCCAHLPSSLPFLWWSCSPQTPHRLGNTLMPADESISNRETAASKWERSALRLWRAVKEAERRHRTALLTTQWASVVLGTMQPFQTPNPTPPQHPPSSNEVSRYRYEEDGTG